MDKRQFKQGEALPPDSGYEGQWLTPTIAFVYRPKGEGIKDATSPRLTAQVHWPDGTSSIGFDVGLLAGAFEITEEAVFEANKQYLLLLLHVQPAILDSGHRGAVFRFGIGDVTREFTVEYVDHSGTA